MSVKETDDSEATTGSTWPGWVAMILGLWVIVTPFFLDGGSSNAFNWLLWSNIVSGLLIAIFAGFVATR